MSAVLKVICCNLCAEFGASKTVISNGYSSYMDKKIWTAAELEKMTPAERSEISRAAEIDIADAPPGMVQRARDFVLARIAAEEGASTS